MSQRLGQILKAQRGSETRLSFAKRLDLSYTFVRSLEEGLRRPSDEVLIEIAAKLDLDPDDLLLAAYCDRSPLLEGAIRRRGKNFIDEGRTNPPGPLPGVSAPGFVETDPKSKVGTATPDKSTDGGAPQDPSQDLSPGRSDY